MSDALDDQVYRAYMEFFTKAEKLRRWRVDEDIPWELAAASPRDARLTLCAEAFSGVEMYLPDYVAQGLNLVRSGFGQAWFTANWAYEESKHAIALREYLLRTGQRTPEQLRDYQRGLFEHRWQLPFATVRQMTLYGALQEMTTFMSYKKQEQAAERVGDALLVRIYRLIARDEMAHCGFYARVTRMMLEEDLEGTRADLAFVFRHFKMPATEFIPRWSEHMQAMAESGLDRAAFLGEVWFPLLRRLGVDRRDLPRVQTPRTA